MLLLARAVLVTPIANDNFSRALLDRRVNAECAKCEIAVTKGVAAYYVTWLPYYDR